MPCLDRVRTIDLRLKTFDLASVEVLFSPDALILIHTYSKYTVYVLSHSFTHIHSHTHSNRQLKLTHSETQIRAFLIERARAEERRD